MRRPIVIGNWKMNKTGRAAALLASEIKRHLSGWHACDVGICPVFTVLDKVYTVVKDSNILLGAQNMHWEAGGAYTGEVAAGMIEDAGCTFVILGHSERRHGLGETDAMVAKKLRSALQHNLMAIVCVGETKTERDHRQTEAIVIEQLRGSLAGTGHQDMHHIVIAYEPVWAIGTGETAAPCQAEEVHQLIRDQLGVMYGKDIAEEARIQYGGSVKPDNAAELLSQKNIDGALVGGASLQTDSFVAIVYAATAAETP